MSLCPRVVVFHKLLFKQKNVLNHGGSEAQRHSEDNEDIYWARHLKIFLHLSFVKYHILKWNTKDQYIIARNDAANPSEAGLYTRIDYMYFADMKPWRWGFCLTVYNAKSTTLAETTAKADRQNPKKGCNGFPFSRMKKEE